MKKRHKRVWFIGAGFTAGVGYPLGKSLVAELVHYLKGANSALLKLAPAGIRDSFHNSVAHPKLKNARDLILRNIATFSETYLARSIDNLQDVQVAEFYSIAQALAEQSILGRDTARISHHNEPDGPQLRRLYYDLAAITRSYFIDICNAVEDHWPADFKAVLNNLDPSVDAMVNFNWDEEVDCYLSLMLDITYTAGNLHNDQYLLLKPHGSIGWYDVAQCIANEDVYFIAEEDRDRIERFEKRLISYEEFDFPWDINDGPGDINGEFLLSCPPVITPPTFGKQFKYREQSLIWQDVIETCRHAEEFIFLGYSIANDDFLTRAAIRCALAEGKKSEKKRPIRCLVVTRLPDVERVLQNFNVSQVFGSPLTYNHVLPWTIGDSDEPRTLFNVIKTKLKKAII